MKKKINGYKKGCKSNNYEIYTLFCGAGGSTQSVYLSLLRLINPIYLSIFHAHKVNEIFLDILG